MAAICFTQKEVEQLKEIRKEYDELLKSTDSKLEKIQRNNRAMKFGLADSMRRSYNIEHKRMLEIDNERTMIYLNAKQSAT